MLTLLQCHATVAGRGRRSDRARTASECLLGRRGKGTEAHARDGYGNLQFDWSFRMPRPKHDIGAAALAIALQRITRHRRAQEKQIVEMRQLSLRAKATDVVDAGRRGALYLGDAVPIERRRLARWHVWDPGMRRGHGDLNRRWRCRRGNGTGAARNDKAGMPPHRSANPIQREPARCAGCRALPPPSPSPRNRRRGSLPRRG